MGKWVIFGGTTEGRLLAEKALRDGRDILVCVTSEYARSLLPEGIPCRAMAMDQEEMHRFLAEQNPERVIDATHPYAVAASRNIRVCTQKLGIPLERIVREEEHASWQDAVQWVLDAQEAARAAAKTRGNVLLTTGSHTLDAYAKQIGKDRLFVRVLPTIDAIKACEASGILCSHIIAMQGPFSSDLNRAIYEQLDIAVMVTKDSGRPGGVDEKVLAALDMGIHVIVIRRPDA